MRRDLKDKEMWDISGTRVRGGQCWGNGWTWWFWESFPAQTIPWFHDLLCSGAWCSPALGPQPGAPRVPGVNPSLLHSPGPLEELLEEADSMCRAPSQQPMEEFPSFPPRHIPKNWWVLLLQVRPGLSPVLTGRAGVRTQSFTGCGCA